MKKIFLTLSRKSYKIFVRPILDYAHMIYGKPLTESFKDKIKMVLHNSALVITRDIKLCYVTVFTKNMVWNPLLNQDGPVRFFLPQINKWSFTCIFSDIY